MEPPHKLAPRPPEASRMSTVEIAFPNDANPPGTVLGRGSYNLLIFAEQSQPSAILEVLSLQRALITFTFVSKFLLGNGYLWRAGKILLGGHQWKFRLRSMLKTLCQENVGIAVQRFSRMLHSMNTGSRNLFLHSTSEQMRKKIRFEKGMGRRIRRLQHRYGDDR